MLDIAWAPGPGAPGAGGLPGLPRARGNEQGGLACCDSWSHKESDMTE